MSKVFKIHPAAAAFPRMPKAEFDELKADIAAHGIRLPILVNGEGNTILDGRNRIMAAHDLRLKDEQIPLEVFQGGDETAEIVSRNIMRRHLTYDQRVSIVAKLRGPQLAKQAETRQRTGRAGDLGLKTDRGDLTVKTDRGRTREKIAKEAKVSIHKAQAALETEKHSPADLESVIEGKEKLAKAYKKAKAKAGKIAKPKPEKPLRERVEAKYVRFMESFAVTDYPKVRAILRELIEKAMETQAR
jgi:hypothetical protein